MTKSEDVRLSFKHYSKLTCENQEKEIFFSDLLARVLEIWQDGTVQKGYGGIWLCINLWKLQEII